MTDQTPPPPPPPGPPTTTETAPAPAERTGGRRGRKTVIGGAAAALVIAAAGGGYAVFDKLDGGGPQPHDVLPASTQFYARLDVDPSASQKVELLKLVRKFPDAAKSIGVDSADQDIRELVFDELLADECPDIDYTDDVEPWLGERIGVGVELEGEKITIAVQTTDEDKARAGIKKLFTCGDSTYGIGFLDGYAILAEKQSTVDDSIAATAKGSLGDKKQFVDDFEALGDQGVASAWADLSAIADDTSAAELLGPDAKQLAQAGSVASTLRVDGNAVELAALTGDTPTGDTQPTDLGKLPSDTVAALSVAGVGGDIGDAFEAFVAAFDSGFAENFGLAGPSAAALSGGPAGTSTAPPTDDPGSEDGLGSGDEFLGSDPGDSFSAQDFIDQIEQETGLQLPEDLETLFGDRLTLAIGGDNLETLPTSQGPDDLTALDVALALTTDQAKGLDLVQRIAQLADQFGLPLVASQTDDGAVLATNQKAADAVVSADGDLGGEPAFADVIPNGDSSYGGLFVNIGAIIDKLEEADPPEDIAADLKEVEPLSAFGFSVSKESDDRSLVSLRVSFKK